MATLFLDPGLLTRRAVIERDEAVPDRLGGASERWVVAGEAWARIEPIAVEVRERFGQREGTATHRVTLRFRPGVERGMRLRVGERALRILSLQDPDETERWLVCRCEEEA